MYIYIRQWEHQQERILLEEEEDGPRARGKVNSRIEATSAIYRAPHVYIVYTAAKSILYLLLGQPPYRNIVRMPWKFCAAVFICLVHPRREYFYTTSTVSQKDNEIRYIHESMDRHFWRIKGP